jgi:hypothetical protein
MRAIRVTFRAVFQQPIGKLNPLNAKFASPIAVEIVQIGAKWLAREILSAGVFTRLGNLASLEQAKAELAANFERQVQDWQIWGRVPWKPLCLSQRSGNGESALTEERMLSLDEIVIDSHGKAFFKQAEDYTHILHAPTIPPGAHVPPAACGAQVNAKCFISTKANVEPSCKGCAEVWRREYKGK